MNFFERISTYGLRETMFDVCDAYFVYYSLYHNGGLTARCRQTGRGISVQLSRMEYRPGAGLGLESLTEPAMEILQGLVCKYEGMAEANSIMEEWLKANSDSE